MDLLHTLERDMKSEVDELKKSLNVSSKSEIDTTKLNKLHKGPLMNFIVNMLGMFDKNIDLCKSAAATCDKLKSEQIELQKQLISVQNNQLSAVQQSVKAEMKTWAEVARKTVSQNSVLTTKVVKEAVKAVSEEEERSTNLIIYGTNDFETPSDPDFEEEEIDNIVRSVCNLTLDNDITPKIKAISRIGQFNQDKSRPIKVEFNSSNTVANILKNARKLKLNSDFKSVYLSPDRTKEQRAAHSKLVKQMKDMISRDNSKHYFIRGNEIKCVDKK